MAHEVTRRDSGWMFHKPAWHGLFDVGHKRPKTIAQARKVAGLTWDVETVPFITLPKLRELAKGQKQSRQLVAQASEFTAVRFRAIVRDDTGHELGVASDEYEPITNREGFEFMEAVLGQTLFEALFSMREGRNVCLLSEFPEWITVGGDKVRRFLYTRLDHSGNGAMWTMATNVRVQCANTDRMAIAEAGSNGIYKVRHIGNTTERIAEARAALNLSVDYAKQFKKLGDRLAKQKIAERTLQQVLAELYPNGDSTRSTKNAEQTRETITTIFLGKGQAGDTTGNAPGTKWCAYNAVTEYMQHYRPMRTKDESVAAERRFVRATEDPQGVQRKALDLLVG